MYSVYILDVIDVFFVVLIFGLKIYLYVQLYSITLEKRNVNMI